MAESGVMPIAFATGDVRTAAQAYFDRGFRLIPLFGVDADGLCMCGSSACKPRDAGKHEPPETDGQWKDGRIFTPQDFRDGQNIGLAMGPWNPPEGHGGTWLVALDVDGHTDVNAFFHPHLPLTLTQMTPMGAHFIYTVRARTPLGNWVDLFGGKKSGAGMTLDLRYARGRIVVAPSRGSQTRGTGRYEWRLWRQPAALPLHVLETIYDLRRQAGKDTPDEWNRGEKEP